MFSEGYILVREEVVIVCTGRRHIQILSFVPADKIGKSFLAGGSLFGIGSLCYYGLGLSNETGAIDRAA